MSDIAQTSSDIQYHIDYPWHKKTWEQFVAVSNKKQVPHAILLSGEEGLAKLNLARRMAKSLICINSGSSDMFDACNQCQSCKTFESGANPDFTEIALLEDKQQIAVDQIRVLSEFLNFSRSYNTHRVVILNPAERMNLNAANSLLKSLEEPASHTVIILVTAKINQLLPTIKSRCQLYHVATPSISETTQWIEKYSQNAQNGNIDVQTLFTMVGNRPLKALKISQDDIDNRNKFLHDLSTVISQEITLTEMAKNWEKYDVEVILDWQINIIQQSLKSHVTDKVSEQGTDTVELGLTKHLTTEEQWQLYQNLIKQKQYIHTSVNSLIFMENMIILWLKTV